MKDRKVCKDCRWMRWGRESGPYCMSPQRPKQGNSDVLELVYGDGPKLEWMYCSHARFTPNACGPDGRWFEPAQSLLPTKFRQWLTDEY